ncbi:hypothetical protein GC175_13410 [bacterium]|nr:hypothetical protein [bacterium]
MCQIQVTLAERGRARYVTQCEHGTVHVVWDGVGFHLPASAFVRMAHHILKTRSVVEETHSPTDQAHCRLQVNHLFVLLPVHEFLPLADMIDEALRCVHTQDGVRHTVEAETMPSLKLSSAKELSLPINLN